MNDERFIEMLNLYIDQELVGAEIQEIEAAIAASPERQRIYAQYCKIERASQLVFAESDVPQPKVADLVAAAHAQDGVDVVEFAPARPRRSTWWAWGSAAAGLAAACFAVVLVLQKPAATPVTTQVATTVPAQEVNDESNYQTVFALHADDNERVPGMRGVDDSFAWMTQLQFEPIERTELDSWEMQSTDPIRVRRLNAKWISPAELKSSGYPDAMTAFQFQR